MNQIVKVLLDHPDKIERFFLWFLQSAIIIWGMSFFMGYNILQITSVEGSLEFNFTGQLSALRLATYLLIFTISWIVVWGMLADLLINVSFRLLNWVIRQIRTILWNIFLAFLYLILWVLSLFKFIQKPRSFWKSTKNDEDDTYKPNEFHAKTQKLTKDVDFFFEMNKWTKSAMGSELLLEIISFEEGEFIRSRMIRYYSISVIISIIQFNVFDFTNHLTLKVILLVILFISGLIVFGFNDLYSKLGQNELFYLIPRLEFEVYLHEIFQSLQGSMLVGDYDIIPKRKFLSLTLKEPENEFKLDYIKSIEVIPLFEKINPPLIAINRFKNSNSMVIFISETIPDPDILKSIEQNKQCLIVANSEDEVFEAIMKLYPFVTGKEILI